MRSPLTRLGPRMALPFGIALLMSAAGAPAQPVTSPLGALARTNEAVGRVDEAAANAGSAGTTADLTAPLPDEGDDLEGADEARGLGYDPEKRRDPFRPLTGEAADTELRKKFEGQLRGLLLSEVKLVAILKHPAGNIATLEGGPKKQGYFARIGDELWDAQVVRIDPETGTVVVRQKLEDPRLIKQWRDIPLQLLTDEEKANEGASSSP